jgi:hypothetical protein
MRIAALLLFLLLATGPALAEESVAELNKQLANPVSSLWSIAFQQNNFLIDPGRHEDLRWNSNLNFQPVMPVAINEDWNLITRPVITAFNSVPHPRENVTPLDWTRSQTFGDSVLLELVSPSPKLAGRWLLGLGPTFIFPTANSKWTGQGKYQAGPAALVGYLDEKWILGLFPQQWYSFSGAGGSRESTSQLNLQPVAAMFFDHGWSVGYSGNILANWKADAGDVWTVPLGVAVGKVQKFGKLPIKIQLAVQYMVVRPDEFGQKWNFQLMFVPVLPKLIKGNLADPSSLHFGMGMGN